MLPEVTAEDLQHLTPAERDELDRLLAGVSPWRPLPGPQTLAYFSEADELFYGGAAGGGKTDLLLGLAGREHHRAIIFRRIFPSLQAIIERSREIYNPDATSTSPDRYNESRYRWRFRDGRSVRFGSIQHETDKTAWQGQPHDFIGFDELPEFTESQFRFVTGWNRTTRPRQRCRVLATGNPPTTAEGEWVITYWGPWLLPNHPNPALPGELRYFTTQTNKDIELPDGRPFVVVDGERVYDFDPLRFKVSEVIRPRSRTFIPASIEDNPFLIAAGYVAKLQALPEPLRSQMLFGDWRAGRKDDAFQVIPTAWVELAQERWRKRARPSGPMEALGADIARGGKCETVLSPRHGNWFAEQRCEPGKDTPDGPAVVRFIRATRTHQARVQIDIIGVGASPYDELAKDEKIRPVLVAMNSAAKTEARDKSGQLGFVNKRAEWWWSLREALDPASGQDLAIPPDPQLKADLCAPRWEPTARGIKIEDKDDVEKRIGRSPDRGDSLVYAHAQESVLQLPDSSEPIMPRRW